MAYQIVIKNDIAECFSNTDYSPQTAKALMKSPNTNVYCTAEHDSLKISNGKWYWWSRGFGGYSALDCLIKVKECSFVEAVEILTGQALADWKPPPPCPKERRAEGAAFTAQE